MLNKQCPKHLALLICPANTRHSPNGVSMLAHRLRRWPNMEMRDEVLNKQCPKHLALLICPANTRHSPNGVSMLAHRLRRWPNMETALDECPVFAW